MRKLNFCILVVLIIGLTAGVAAAQELRHLFPINVPFNFVVGNKSFPAGEYDVIGSMGHPLVMIKDWQSKNVACENAIPSSSLNIAERSALHFHRYGNTYFLTKVTVAGTTTSRVLRKSKLERELELASTKPENVRILSAMADIKR